MDYVEPCLPRASVSVETQTLEDLGLDPKTQKASYLGYLGRVSCNLAYGASH